MRLVKLESYPNREIRVVTARSQAPSKFVYEEKELVQKQLVSLPSPTCHSVKTLQPAPEGSYTGLLPLTGKPGYGGLPRRQKFSTYGRRQLLRAGGALESVAPHHECLFLTLTLPGSTREAKEALSRFSALAVKMLKSWLSNYLASNLSLYTWELQKRGALHLHYVVHCPDRERGDWVVANLQRQWIRILDAISARSSVDMFRKTSGFTWASNKEITRTDGQWCKKSVAAYLSKYVSKGGAGSGISRQIWFCPSRWYGVSRPLLAVLRSLSHSLKLDSVRDSEAWGIYHDCLSILQAFSVKCYEYKHRVGDGSTAVSYSLANEQDSIWNTIMTHIGHAPDSQENLERNLLTHVRSGACLMRKHRAWFQAWRQFCANSRPNNVIESGLSPGITQGDLVYVLDMLTYTYRYTLRTQSRLPGECSLWYTNLMSFLYRIDSSGDRGYRCLIPDEILLQFQGKGLTGGSAS